VCDAELCDVLGLTGEPIDTLRELAAELTGALVERPSPLAKQGEIFRPEFDAELRDLDALRRNGTERMVELEARLRENTALPRYASDLREFSAGTSRSVAANPAAFRLNFGASRPSLAASATRYRRSMNWPTRSATPKNATASGSCYCCAS